MPFRSILFGDSSANVPPDNVSAPACFHDLNLDQIVSSITENRDEYNLKPYFYASLKDIETIEYRQEIMRDFENDKLALSVRLFGRRMRTMRLYLTRFDKITYIHEKRRWFLEAGHVYCDAIRRLSSDLVSLHPASAGLEELQTYLDSYVGSSAFSTLEYEIRQLKAELDSIQYNLDIVGSRITVDRYTPEPDYRSEVLATFAKFEQKTTKEYQFEFPQKLGMNHVEEGILNLIVSLYPRTFTALGEYCEKQRAFIDRTIEIFDREVQFYIAYIEFIRTYREADLRFSYPVITRQSKEIYAGNMFDLSLAINLVRQKMAIVENDFYLHDDERIIVVSGPNQGGKTTFARAFGQIHHLASIGCPVPATGAKLYLFDRIFTHFERAENLHTLSGKLEDDLNRMHRIIEQATPSSILIMNESFTSTALSDAIFVSKRVMEQIIRLDMICVSVTFLEELAHLGKSTVSMVSSVKEEDNTQCTFKIVRRTAGGLAYADVIAARHHLDYESIKRRIAS